MTRSTPIQPKAKQPTPKPDVYNRHTSAAQARLAEALEITGYSPDIFARAGLGGVGGGHYIRRGAFSLMREEVWAIMAVERAGVKLSTPEIAEATGTVHSAVSMALQRRAARVAGSGAPVPAKPGPKPEPTNRPGGAKGPKLGPVTNSGPKRGEPNASTVDINA